MKNLSDTKELGQSHLTDKFRGISTLFQACLTQKHHSLLRQWSTKKLSVDLLKT